MMIKLFCAVVGDGSVFPVDIDVGQTVGDLKEKVKEKKQYAFPADELTLYLAKKDDGKWLAYTSEEVAALENGDASLVQDLLVTKLHPVRKIHNVFTNLDDDDAIHVLVKLPNETKANTPDNTMLEAIKTMQEKINTIAESLSESKKRKSVAFSSMSSKGCGKLVNKLNLKRKTIYIEEAALKAFDGNINGFEWKDNESENNHAESYCAYVKNHLRKTLNDCNLTVIPVHDKNHLLSIRDDRLPFNLSGSTDMLILEDMGDQTKENASDFQDLRMAIEVKKDLSKDPDLEKGLCQAITELIAMDLKTEESAMVLLTDLNHKWVFMWLGDGYIYKMTLSQPSHAFAFMREAIPKWNQFNGSDGNVYIPFPGYEQPLKRRKIDDMIPSEATTEAEHTLCDMIARYRSIKDDLGDDWTMPREIGRFMVQNMPAFRYVSESPPHMYT